MAESDDDTDGLGVGPVLHMKPGVKYTFAGLPNQGGKPTALHTFFQHRPKSDSLKDGPIENFDHPGPFIILDGMPEDEDAASNLSLQLSLLNYYVRCFEADVELYEYSAEVTARARVASDKLQSEFALELFDGWPVIAARDGAMSIYHFGKTLSGIDETIAQTKNLKKYIPQDIRGEARKMFKEAFPDFVHIRHGAAHSGDRTKSPDKTAQHSATEAWSNDQFGYQNEDGAAISFLLTDVLSNSKYSNTWAGKVHSYEISLDSLKKLAAVRDKIYEAFPPGINLPPPPWQTKNP